MNHFRHKHIWIIGASSGIGYALAKELSKRQARLIISARNSDKLEGLKAEIQSNDFEAPLIQPLDVSNLKAIQNTVQSIQQKFQQIDSIIYLAALYEPSRLDTFDIEKTKRLIDVNLMGAFNLIHCVLPIFQSQQYGQLALCGSVTGFRGLPNAQPYGATKAAMINLAQSLKAENPQLDIKLINPGFVRTPLTDKNDFAMPMLIEPDQAAKAIANGLLKNSFEIHFPKKFTWLMKLLGILPHFLYFKIAHQLSKKL